MIPKSLKQIFWPVFLFFLLLILYLNERDFLNNPDPDVQKYLARVEPILATLLGMSAAWMLNRLLYVLFWPLIEFRIGTAIPRLLKDILAALVMLTAMLAIMSIVFNKSLTGVWATSGILGIFLGFALRNMIADIFAGIALNVDQPFKIGDWIILFHRSINPKKGCVTEITWRSTRLRSLDNTLTIIPNSIISSMILTNLSKPEPKSRFELDIQLDFNVPVERAFRILLAGVKSAKGPLENPPPKILVQDVTDSGISYLIRYWLEPAEVSPKKGRNRVLSSIMEHLHHAGLTPAHEKHDVFLAKIPNRHQLDKRLDRTSLLERMEIFSSLEEPELAALAEKMTEHFFSSGDAIVRKGEPGSSMYILMEGLMQVYSTSAAAASPKLVDFIRPGEFFGEMSLLTGEPRIATVIAATDAVAFEIGKEDLNSLLVSRPEIAVHIAQVIAARVAQVEMMKGRTVITKADDTSNSLAETLLDKMKSLFSCLRNAVDPSNPQNPNT
jgi:small-conductance mechanosensitive channel